MDDLSMGLLLLSSRQCPEGQDDGSVCGPVYPAEQQEKRFEDRVGGTLGRKAGATSGGRIGAEIRVDAAKAAVPPPRAGAARFDCRASALPSVAIDNAPVPDRRLRAAMGLTGHGHRRRRGS